MRYLAQLTTGTKHITIDLIHAVLDGDLLRQQHDGAFGSAVCTGAGFQSDEAEHGSRVYDPATVTRGVEGLG